MSDTQNADSTNAECPDLNCHDGITSHTESAHSPYCDCDTIQSTCPVPVQVQDHCPWPGHTP